MLLEGTVFYFICHLRCVVYTVHIQVIGFSSPRNLTSSRHSARQEQREKITEAIFLFVIYLFILFLFKHGKSIR